MDIPAWAAATGALISFLTGLFGDLLKRVIPAYNELVNENRELRKEIQALQEEIDGLIDTVRDDAQRDTRGTQDTDSSEGNP